MDFAGQAPVGYTQLSGHRPVLEATPNIGKAYKQYSAHLRRPRSPLIPLTIYRLRFISLAIEQGRKHVLENTQVHTHLLPHVNT